MHQKHINNIKQAAAAAEGGAAKDISNSITLIKINSLQICTSTVPLADKQGDAQTEKAQRTMAETLRAW